MDNAYNMGRKRGQEESRKEIDNLRAVNKQLSDDKALMHKEIERLRKEKEWLVVKVVKEQWFLGHIFTHEDLREKVIEDLQQALKE